MKNSDIKEVLESHLKQVELAFKSEDVLKKDALYLFTRNVVDRLESGFYEKNPLELQPDLSRIGFRDLAKKVQLNTSHMDNNRKFDYTRPAFERSAFGRNY